MNENSKLKNKFIFNWVLTNKLAIGTSPMNNKDLILLKKNKVKNILCLCSEKESKWHSELENNFSCYRFILPDSNQKKLPTKIQIDKAYEILKKLVRNNITFVHCFASIERSPLLCIMFIMDNYNLNLEESLDYVKRVHYLTNPRNNQLFTIEKYFSNT